MVVRKEGGGGNIYSQDCITSQCAAYATMHRVTLNHVFISKTSRAFDIPIHSRALLAAILRWLIATL